MKKQIRKQALKARRSLSPQDKLSKSQKIQTQLITLPEFQKAHKILLYHNLAEEVSTTNLIEHFLKEKYLILPRVEEKKLVLHHIDGFRPLKKGGLGVYEPHLENTVVEPSTVELAIIPGVAFDKNKHRIGFGKGFYDRLLKNLNCPVVALAYQCQIVEVIPNEEHDEPVHIIITESQTIK